MRLKNKRKLRGQARHEAVQVALLHLQRFGFYRIPDNTPADLRARFAEKFIPPAYAFRKQLLVCETERLETGDFIVKVVDECEKQNPAPAVMSTSQAAKTKTAAEAVSFAVVVTARGVVCVKGL